MLLVKQEWVEAVVLRRYVALGFSLHPAVQHLRIACNKIYSHCLCTMMFLQRTYPLPIIEIHVQFDPAEVAKNPSLIHPPHVNGSDSHGFSMVGCKTEFCNLTAIPSSRWYLLKAPPALGQLQMLPASSKRARKGRDKIRMLTVHSN
jgi:hypothetical protein